MLTCSLAGAGKTKLASKVVDDLLRDLGSRSDMEALAYFYCDRNQSDRRTAESALRSFVRQLSASRDAKALQDYIVGVYSEKRRNSFASGKLDVEECENVLLSLTDIYPQTTLVLDALDECDPDTRVDLIEIFERLVARTSKPIKIFVSSRPDADIKERFEEGINVAITATDNYEDIARFVEDQIDKKRGRRFEVFRRQELRKRITQTLLDKSQGM